MEETISLMEIIDMLKKRWALILSAMLFFIGLAGIYSLFYSDKEYKSSAQLVAKLEEIKETQSPTGNLNDVNFNLQMINTYKDFVESDVVLEQAKEILVDKIAFEGTIADLTRMLVVEQNSSSQMFSISAVADNPRIAKEVANAAATVFKEQSSEIMNVDKVSIMSEAPVNMTPVSPNTKRNLLIGAALGLMAGVGLTFLMELFDKTVKNSQFSQDKLNLPVLGELPQLTEKEVAEALLVNQLLRQPQEAETQHMQSSEG